MERLKATLAHWRAYTRQLKTETYTLYLAYQDPRVPWYARVLIAGVVAYAFSPIDLIPDFIPVLGYLDDVVLVPLGLALALKMIPAEVLAESRARAQAMMTMGKPVNRLAAGVIILIWVTTLVLIVWLVARQFA